MPYIFCYYILVFPKSKFFYKYWIGTSENFLQKVYKLNFSGDAYTYRIAAIEEKPESSTGFYAQAWFPVTQAEGEPIQGEA